MHHSTQNAILTKLLLWEYGNRLPYFHGENLAEFRVWYTMVYQQGFAFVYTVRINMLVLWWAETLQSIKHVDACHIHWKTNVTQVTWIKTITPWWSCTQYSMNVHLQQLPWAHTYTIRSRALMISEGHSRNHKSPLEKGHNHPHTRRHISIFYILTNSRNIWLFVDHSLLHNVAIQINCTYIFKNTKTICLFVWAVVTREKKQTFFFYNTKYF